MTPMTETGKLSVEKALNKLRKSDQPKSSAEKHDEQIEALEEEIKRMQSQRLRLEGHQRRSKKPG
jgi:hypothetical protein